MPLTTSHTPGTKPGKLKYTLSWTTRFGRDILEDYDVRVVLLAALDTAAATNGVQILSVATTGSSVRCQVLAPASLSPSTILVRLKNEAARKIAASYPDLVAAHGAVFRRKGSVEPFVPESFLVPTHAESDSSEAENPAVSFSGTNSTGSALSGSAPDASGASDEV
jgi:hypothetical protein